jgi:hypothetical protein
LLDKAFSPKSRTFVTILFTPYINFAFSAAYLQEDQIGQIFAHWVSIYVVTLGSYLKLTEETNISGLMFPRLRSCNTFDKNVLSYILGDFLTNPSGHPGLHIHTSFKIITFLLSTAQQFTDGTRPSDHRRHFYVLDTSCTYVFVSTQWMRGSRVHHWM